MYVHCISKKPASPSGKHEWKIFDIMPTEEGPYCFDSFRDYIRSPEYIAKHGVLVPGGTNNEEFITHTFRNKP